MTNTPKASKTALTPTVNGSPDNDFSEDPDYVTIWDPRKRVFRNVHRDTLKEDPKTLEAMDTSIKH